VTPEEKKIYFRNWVKNNREAKRAADNRWYQKNKLKIAVANKKKSMAVPITSKERAALQRRIALRATVENARMKLLALKLIRLA
jgi:hypothetical protein